MTFPYPNGRGKRPRGAPIFVATPVDRKTIATSATTFIFEDVNYGPAYDYRSILVAYANKGSGNANDLVFPSAKISGITPLKVGANGWEVVGCGVLIADIPVLTSGDVSLTFAKAQGGGCTIEVYSLRNFAPGPSVGPTSEFSTGNAGSSGDTSNMDPADIAVASGALGFGVGVRNATTSAPNWLGGLTGISNDLAGNGTFRLMVAAEAVSAGAVKNYRLNGLGGGAAKAVAIGSINP